MRVGILTFHKAYNYGAILQAFALQDKVKEFGKECEIIDYLSVEKEKTIKLFSVRNIKGISAKVRKLIKDSYRFKKKYTFDKFIAEELTISQQRYKTYEDMHTLDKMGIYDVYIVGSDQVWNIGNNQGNPVFLLSFVDQAWKRSSYAASFGNCELEGEMYDAYFRELSKFRVLSVREESSILKYDFLTKYYARTVLDPTLLLKSSRYKDIESKPIVNKRYAFMYTIKAPNKLRKYAEDFCKKNNLRLIDSKKTMLFFWKSSPRDFLSFIANAEYVFTNSFHGTAFSIIYHKNFITEVDNGISYNNRSMDLMKKLRLECRDLNDKCFNAYAEIDYDMVDKVLEQFRFDSIKVLKEIIDVK